MRFSAIAVGVCLTVFSAARAEKGLVGHWNFDEGNGTVARDGSGHKHHGQIHGAVFVKQGMNHALRFDGKDDFVDCGARPGLAIETAGTIEFWLRPEALQGGLVNWSTGGRWNDQRLVFAFATMPGNTRPLFLISDGKSHSNGPAPGLATNVWTHVALTFDGKTLSTYCDGIPQGTAPQARVPGLKGVPLWFGRCQGIGKGYLRGLMDEVRIYNRPLSATEVLNNYKQNAGAMGKETAYFNKPELSVTAITEPGWIGAYAKCRMMPPFPAESMLEATLCRAGHHEVLGRTTARTDPRRRDAILLLNVGRLPTGNYVVRATLRRPDGIAVGEPTTKSLTWPGRDAAFTNVKILNNIVWELLNTRPGQVAGTRKYTFRSPRTRWVYVAATADVGKGGQLGISLDNAPQTHDVILSGAASNKTLEAMRFLPAGTHTLALKATGKCNVHRLIVRSIPELIYSHYMSNPHVKEFGPYGGAFVKKHIEKNVNTFVTSNAYVNLPAVKEWKQHGGRWLVDCPVPKNVTVDTAAAHIAKTTGFNAPFVDGSIGDEFGSSHPYCADYAGAVRKLRTSPSYRDRLFYPYASDLYGGEPGREFVQGLMDTGNRIAFKRYLRTQPNEEAARHFLRDMLVRHALAYRTLCPGSLEHVAVCFGYLSAPPEFLCIDPGVNYRVYLDMQFNLVANHPAFWGTYGLMTYLADYADEETVRWASHLFRYYGIEGNTAPATDDPYDMHHLRNADFADGTSEWTIQPAAAGTIRPDKFPGFSTLQGRWPTTPQGDTVLVTLRNAARPNSFRQEIRNLERGRLYSFRMFSADFRDMATPEKHVVTIKLDNVTLLPEKCFTHLGHNSYAHSYGPYNTKHKAWMNYHWRVFRARGRTATLRVSDWASDPSTGSPRRRSGQAGQAKPGGRVGQELMFNYVKVQPYFPD